MIFIGTLFCNLHRDDNGLHLRQKEAVSQGDLEVRFLHVEWLHWGCDRMTCKGDLQDGSKGGVTREEEEREKREE